MVNLPLHLIWLVSGLWLILAIFVVFSLYELRKKQTEEWLTQAKQQEIYALQQKEQWAGQQLAQQEALMRMQSEQTKQLQQYFISQIADLRSQFSLSLQGYSKTLDEHFSIFAVSTDQNMSRMNKHLNDSLEQQFTNTRETFSRLMQHLTVIDEAQKQMGQLSDRVLNLQQLLSDKRSRGTLGEMQLDWILQSAMPASSYALQYTLSNGCRADSVLKLPPPVGLLAVDAKFPLDSYRKMVDEKEPQEVRKAAAKTFASDIKKHVTDVASKYIIANETSDCAMIFVPSEAVFAEIHSNYPSLVEFSYQSKVWLVSPTTLMAVLTTAGMVLKDLAVKEHLAELQEHLKVLGGEFSRFERHSLAYEHHMQQMNRDWEQLKLAAQKLLVRFQRISALDLDTAPAAEKTLKDDE